MAWRTWVCMQTGERAASRRRVRASTTIALTHIGNFDQANKWYTKLLESQKCRSQPNIRVLLCLMTLSPRYQIELTDRNGPKEFLFIAVPV